MHSLRRIALCALAVSCADTSAPPNAAQPDRVTLAQKAAEPARKLERASTPTPTPAPVAEEKPDAQLQAVQPKGLLKVIGSSGGGSGEFTELVGGSGDEGKFGKRGVVTGSGAGGLGLRGVGVGGGGAGYGVGRGAVGHALVARLVVEPPSSERYQHTGVNGWTLTSADAQSTFAIDVDTASYALGRRKLRDGSLPPPDSVRVEEWLNSFHYTYPQPPAGSPFTVTLDAAPSPLSPGKHLLRVGLQGRRVPRAERKPAHLTFLVDVSGSMEAPDRLPLAKRALRLLVDELDARDTVALVTYAGATKLVLRPTSAAQKAVLHDAIDALTAEGSTAMSSGLELAYAQAAATLDDRFTSRVIVLSDGDANVGDTTHEQILAKIRGHVKEGVTLTTVGFGVGNYHSALMEQLADQGNGNHVYVDSLFEARRVFVEELGGTLEVIAQDVKLQVEFDPSQVNAYRLVGYENRDVADRDFRNDKVDGGELGSGHTVTALYEVDLKAGAGQGLATVRVRAKKPRGVEASEQAFVFPAAALARTFADAPVDLRFATAVMGGAEVTRRSPWAAEWSLDQLRALAAEATEGRPERQQFVELVARSSALLGQRAVR